MLNNLLTRWRLNRVRAKLDYFRRDLRATQAGDRDPSREGSDKAIIEALQTRSDGLKARIG